MEFTLSVAEALQRMFKTTRAMPWTKSSLAQPPKMLHHFHGPMILDREIFKVLLKMSTVPVPKAGGDGVRLRE
jgi:hypothetical protein